MTDFQQQIRNAYEHLTNIQRTIADYFLEHLDTIPFKRLEELADLIGVSTTSVIRFTRSIGYQGYGDMQQDYPAFPMARSVLYRLWQRRRFL